MADEAHANLSCSSADISNLQENFSKQQEKISALKELVAQGKSSSAQEKVKNLAQRLTMLKSKARSRRAPSVVATNIELEGTQAPTGAAPAYDQLNDSEANEPALRPVMYSPMTSNFASAAVTPQQRLGSLTCLGDTSGPGSTTGPGSEKFHLLRQQIEHNRARLAQRASSKQHLEQLVTQLKEKFDSAQQCLDDTTELGRSMTNLSDFARTSAGRERHRSATDLSSQQPFSLEKERIKFLENRCRLLEKQLEKERQPTHLIAREEPNSQEMVSAKRIKELENTIVDLEETLKSKHTEVQRLSTMTADGSAELLQKNATPAITADVLVRRSDNELAACKKRIEELVAVNELLETTRTELSAKLHVTESRLQETASELDDTNKCLLDAREDLLKTQTECEVLQQSMTVMHNNAAVVEPTTTASVGSVDELRTDQQVKAGMAIQIQELCDELQLVQGEKSKLQQTISEMEQVGISEESIGQKIIALETTIATLHEELNQRDEAAKQHTEELMEKTIELNVLHANFKALEENLQAANKPLFPTAATASNIDHDTSVELHQLKQKLDESNKAMIKLRLKCKHAEKQVEKLQKASHLHGEVVLLDRTNVELQQRLAELEEEKGQWQLGQVDVVGAGNPSESEETSFALIAELESKNRIQSDTIRLLEQQHYECTEKQTALEGELDALKERAKDLQFQESSERALVKSELSQVQLEERVEEQGHELVAVHARLAAKQAEVELLSRQLDELREQRHHLDQKIEQYMHENIELLGKVEKLSQSSSSAESIEIVERLTQCERAELDLQQGSQPPMEQSDLCAGAGVEATTTAGESGSRHKLVSELTQTEIGPELSESLLKLREESSELMNKIELFTAERREVLEKMEHLTADNLELTQQITALQAEKTELEVVLQAAKSAKGELEQQMAEVVKEKDMLASQVAESRTQRTQLSQELTSLQQSSEVVASLDSRDGATLFSKCELSLCKLSSELEAYRRANDKNAKFNASKKLAKEAKNAHTQLSELLQKVREASTAVETVTVVETVVAVTAPNGKALAEYEQLTALNRELRADVAMLRRKLEEAGSPDSTALSPVASSVAIVEVAATPQPDDSKGVEAAMEEAHAVQRQLRQSLAEQAENYESQLSALQLSAEQLRLELHTAVQSEDERAQENAMLRQELAQLRQISEDFDRLINDKEMAHEQQVVQLTRYRRELEGKCETYEGELEILQALVGEQKQQLIEACSQGEEVVNAKLSELQQRDELIERLRNELQELKRLSALAGARLSDDLERDSEAVREALRIHKALVAEQLDELANKQETIETLNQQLIELYKTMEASTNTLIEKDDELALLHAELDGNAADLEVLRKDNTEQKAVVDKLLIELHSHRESTLHMTQLQGELDRQLAAAKQLQAANADLEQRNQDQLGKLKKYSANLKKRVAQCQQYEALIKTTDDLHAEQLKVLALSKAELTERIGELEKQLNDRDVQVEQFQKQTQELPVDKSAAVIFHTQLDSGPSPDNDRDQLSQQAQQLANVAGGLVMVKECDLLSDLTVSPAVVQPPESTTIVADGGTTSHLLNDLHQAQLHSANAEHTLAVAQTEVLRLLDAVGVQRQAADEYKQTIEQLQQQLRDQTTSANEELNAKTLKFEKSKTMIKDRNNQIHRLQATIRELQQQLSVQPEEDVSLLDRSESELRKEMAGDNTLSQESYTSLKQAYEQLQADSVHEKAAFEATIARLETLHDGIQAKLQEDLVYIETIELENMRFKEKICRLEECVATLEDRRASMERRAHLMDEQLQTTAYEHERTEDALVYRLNALAEHDDVIGRRLLESQEEKDELQERSDRLQQELQTLSVKYSNLERDHQANLAESTSRVEAELASLRASLASSEVEQQKLRASYDAQLAVKTTELDELECELGEQLAKMNAEQRALQEHLERARDDCNEQQDEVVRLREQLHAAEQARAELEREATWLRLQSEGLQQDQYELQELRMQALQDKTELDNLHHQIDTLAGNHEAELLALRTQIAELDSLRMEVGRNQTDDQVFIETENKRLTDLLAEKAAIIDGYQRHNPQMSAAVPALESEERERLEMNLAEKSEQVVRLQVELGSLVEGNADMQRQVVEKNREIEQLRLTASTNRTTAGPALAADVFFVAEPTSLRSPFDDIVLAHNQDALGRARPAYSVSAAGADEASAQDAVVGASDGNGDEQPTIEDLQRNVSDLEKHAQDLENKLATRNQREADLEERLRDADARWQTAQAHYVNEERRAVSAESRLLKLDQQLKEVRLLAHIESDRVASEAQERTERMLAELRSEVNKWKAEVEALQAQLRQRDYSSALHSEHFDEHFRVATMPPLEKHDAHTTDKDADIAAFAQFQPTLDMFFGDASKHGTAETVFESLNLAPLLPAEPVIEETIVPQKAYVCQPEDQKPLPPSTNTDNWDDVWGGAEAAAEEAHYASKAAAATTIATSQRPSLMTREQQLEVTLLEYQEQAQEQQLVLERCEQQKLELQVKAGRLVKKLKEYKAKVEELQMSGADKRSKSSSEEPVSMFADLDSAIQDELSAQITRLESRLIEQQKALETANTERTRLLQRIDMLTVGNERMAEMKERQDMDVQMYQARIRDLQERLQKLEDWDVSPVELDADNKQQVPALTHVQQATPPLTSEPAKSADWNRQLTELRADLLHSEDERQEMAALLEEERALRRNTEKTIVTLQQRKVALEESASNNEASTKIASAQEQFNQNKARSSDQEARIAALTEDARRLHEQLTLSREEHSSAEAEMITLRTRLDEALQAQHELKSTSDMAVVALAKAHDQLAEYEQRLSALAAKQTPPEANEPLTATPASCEADMLRAQLLECEAEVTHLKQRVEDLMREDQTEKLVLEILAKNQELQLLRMQVKHLEEDKRELEHSLSEQAAGNRDDDLLCLAEQKRLNAAMTLQIQELREERAQMEEELRVLNNHVLGNLEQENRLKTAVLELDARDIEIAELRRSLAAAQAAVPQQSSASASPTPPQDDVAALNTQWAALVEQRCGEVAQMWRAHSDQREAEFRAKEESLQVALVEAQRTATTIPAAATAAPPLLKGMSVETTTSTPASEPSTSLSSSAQCSKDSTPLRSRDYAVRPDGAEAASLQEADEIIEKMQSALESQEMEIVTLKEQLAIRSAEYARLAAQYDPFKLQTTSSHSGMKAAAASAGPSNLESTGGGAAAATKTDLDLALYMLHQRDMRCEEMQLELVSLVGERDTLQLKLSNTLRQLEDMRARRQLNPPFAGVNPVEPMTPSRQIGAELEHALPSSEPVDELTQKLSQLQTVNHSMDKTVKEGREQRIWQMEQIKQDVARMPSAAVAELLGTDLSQSSHSPSSTLLNWLWGHRPATAAPDHGGSTPN